MLVAIDVDSTLHDYWTQFRSAAQQLHGVELPYSQQTDWSVDVLTGEQLGQVIDHTHTDAQIAAGVAYGGAADVIRAWHGAGHRILITTHRRPSAHGVTAGWLDAAGIPFHDLRCGYLKVDHCEEVGVDLLIDDSPTNLRDALGRGVGVATLRHPWNARLLSEEPAIVRGDGWAELAVQIAARWPSLSTDGIAPDLGP